MPKIQTVTLTIPLDVFDRIFDILGSRHIVDPDTEYILSSLNSAYLAQVSPNDQPIKYIKDETYYNPQNIIMREIAAKQNVPDAQVNAKIKP